MNKLPLPAIEATVEFACDACGMQVLGPDTSERVETITSCPEGGTCVLVRVDDDPA